MTRLIMPTEKLQVHRSMSMNYMVRYVISIAKLATVRRQSEERHGGKKLLWQ